VQLVIDAPFGREEQPDRLRGGSEPGFDPLAGAGQLGGGLAAVFVGLAEQPLAVDGVQRPSPQPAERQAEASELLILPFGHPQHDLGRGVVAQVLEALLDAAQCDDPWASASNGGYSDEPPF
jgi:hypothetical protein